MIIESLGSFIRLYSTIALIRMKSYSRDIRVLIIKNWDRKGEEEQELLKHLHPLITLHDHTPNLTVF